MNGILYYEGEKPKIGTPVIIDIDSVNHPTGLWTGYLTELGDSDYDSVPNKLDPMNQLKTRVVYCTARINGKLAVVEAQNYNVYVRTRALDLFMETLDRANDEIKGLKKRLDIERGVWHGMLKALVSKDGFEQLTKVLDEFLTKLRG